MDAGIIEDFYIRQHAICCESLGHYARRANADDLHRLRVAIKKIKAVLTIIHDVNGTDTDAFFAPYRAVFRQAGVIRQDTLTRDKLKELSHDRKAVMHRTQHISALAHQLKSDIPAHLRDTEAVHTDTRTMLRSSSIDIQPYCKSLAKKLKKKWRRLPAHTDYHTLRKHLKQLLYTASLLSPENCRELISDHRIRSIDKLQDLIGRWHDHMDMSSQVLTDVTDHGGIMLKIEGETKKLRKKIWRKGDKLWGH